MHNKAVIGTFFATLRFGVASPLYPKTPLHKKCPIQRRYINEVRVLTLESLNQLIEQCKILVAKGEEKPEELEWLLQFREDMENKDEGSWAAYNELIEHLPKEDQDPLLVILKGQLLIERLVVRFIISRLSNPEPFIKLQLNAASCIGIAESMCTANKEPVWLWSQVKELNSIRNKLAHNLIDEKIEKRIENFVSTIANHEGLHNKTITGAISRLYGMLKGLCEVAESSEFKLYK